jgi:glycosyltransferase involved in cell wall biosynthesis
MNPTVAFDARDATAPELRGWGRYARCLVDALTSGVAALAGLEVWPLAEGGWGPEALFEQVKLPWALWRSGAAVVHAPNCFLPLVRPCPGVVTVHDLAFEAWPDDFAVATRWKYRVLARLAARGAERVICPSSFTRADVVERWGVDPAVVRVIPEAPALPVGAAAAPAERYVLGVGDLRRKKNFETLVRAFVEWRRGSGGAPVRLVLAGVDAGSSAELRALAGDAPLELTGYVSDERLDALIRGAELLVHPSLYEGFGLVVLEAMARGTPVLAARATALPETGGDAASYFDPANPQSLVEELGRLLGDASARAELSRRGLDRVRRFSWERTARETASVYLELLS